MYLFTYLPLCLPTHIDIPIYTIYFLSIYLPLYTTWYTYLYRPTCLPLFIFIYLPLFLYIYYNTYLHVPTLHIYLSSHTHTQWYLQFKTTAMINHLPFVTFLKIQYYILCNFTCIKDHLSYVKPLFPGRRDIGLNRRYCTTYL